MTSCKKLFGIFFAGALLHTPLAVGDEADVLNVNATLATMRDNNLFRLAPSVDPKKVGLDGKSEVINTAVLGLNFNKLFGVQRIIANVNMVDNRYQTNSYLNFAALNYDAKWLWAIGQRWTGDLSFSRAEALNSFTDYTNFKQRNVRTTENERFNANYWFHTEWAVVAGLSRTSLTNEQVFLADSDYNANGYNFGLRYRPTSGNNVTVRASRLDGNYSKRKFNALAQYDNGFTQDNYGVDFDWRLTGKSQFRGRMDYIDRQHEHFADRNYAGMVGNLDYVYAYSGKGNMTFGYKHGLESYQQVTNSYYSLDEFNLAAQWAATAQITAAARAGYGVRSYKGEIAPLPAGFQQREDKFTRVGLDLAYQPARWLQLKAGVSLENRNVNYDALDYKDRTGFLSATAQY